MVIGTFKALKVSLGMALLATVCSAAGSVASVTSAQPFSVDGVQLSNPGVNSWPLISNDEVSTTLGAALMTFRDGSAIKMAPQSHVRLAGSVSAPLVILMAGNVETKLAPGSKLLVTRDPNADKDNGTPDDYGVANTGARTNNNTPFRKAAFLYFATGVSLAGLALATDAILQPSAASPR
jgi:hypothetical protein